MNADKDIKKEKRNQLLSALFSKAKRIGIEQEFLRDTIAPNIIKKRLHEASSKEIFKVLEHLVKVTGKTTPFNSPFKKGDSGGFRYKSSRAGLIMELTDVAKARWGGDFEKPLNAFVNSHLKVHTHYKFLDVTFLKAIKERVKEMNRENISHGDTEAQRKSGGKIE